MNCLRTFLLVSLAIMLISASALSTVPQLINYQAQITDTSGSPLDTTVDVTFKIWDAPTGGTELWSETHSSLSITGGNLSVLLGSITSLDETQFVDSAIYLGITVGSDAEIEPRNRVASVPYAYRLETVDGAKAGNLEGTLVITPGQAKALGEALLIKNDSGQVVFSAKVNSLGTVEVSLFDPVDNKSGGGRAVVPKIILNKDGVLIHGATAADTSLFLYPNGNISGVGQIAMGENSSGATWGTVFGYNNTASGDSATVSGGYNNNASGNASAVGGGHHNNADSAGATISGGGSNIGGGYYSTIGGGSANHILAPGTGQTIAGGTFNEITNGEASTIAGGRENICTNASRATIGGGLGNTIIGTNASTISGGWMNYCSGINATIGGGLFDSATSTGATVGGGESNKASGINSTVAGGSDNLASSSRSTVGGGFADTASSAYATVPGGYGNKASGVSSFAAGQSAKATHIGSFVWSSGSGSYPSFGSTANYQFNVRSSGGVRIYTDTLLTSGVTMGAGASAWSPVSDKNVKKDIREVNPDELLMKLSEIPISRWKYIAEKSQADHIGPMAQDFYSAFGLGDDDKRISTIDADGVALAAIKGLIERNKNLERRNDELSSRLDELEKLVKKLIEK